MQVPPIKPALKAPGTKHLKLKCDTLLLTSAFKFNLRRYIGVVDATQYARFNAYDLVATTVAVPAGGGGGGGSTAGAYTRSL